MVNCHGQSPEQYIVPYAHTPVITGTGAVYSCDDDEHHEFVLECEAGHTYACQGDADAPMQPAEETYDQCNPCYVNRGSQYRQWATT